jgi:alkaline phosphatase
VLIFWLSQIKNIKSMKKLLIILFSFLVLTNYAQQNAYLNGDYKAEEGGKVYISKNKYNIEAIKPVNNKNAQVKNVILLIGDGMGLAHIFAAMTVNNDRLYIDQAPYIGLQKTKARNKYRTDSAASGSALATGKKTNYGVISMDEENNSSTTILEYAAGNGYSTGLVATSKITHATPAAFIAHASKRSQYDQIANYFINDSLNVFLGGGYTDFYNPEKGINHLPKIKAKGFQLITQLEELQKIKSGKIAGLFADGHMESYSKRGEFLVEATQKAIEILSQNKKGFFLMVEGSQIDWASHDNDIASTMQETLEFDRAVGEALKFAAKDGHTLVIITADHETGGLSVIDGDINAGLVEGKFNSSGHTSILVPVFAYGPGAEDFIGIYENTAIFDKMKKAFGF